MQIALNAVHIGDARALAAALAPGSVQAVITSPPYFGLRSYLPADHPDKAAELGAERTPDEYVANLVALFAALRPALRDDGSIWLNLGDSYAMSTRGAGWQGKQHTNTGSVLTDRSWRVPQGLKEKDLIGIPWLVAFALRADGWYLRSDIIWHKPNPMPESVRDRPTRSHEYLFLLSKSARYFYDAEAIAEPAAEMRAFPTWEQRKADGAPMRRGDPGQSGDVTRWAGVGGDGTTRNKRDVWTIATEPYPDAHFAVFPTELVRPCVRAGTPEHGCCAACGAPWRRVVEREWTDKGWTGGKKRADTPGQEWSDKSGIRLGGSHDSRTVGWSPSCACGTTARRPAVVLDCFAGSGTTAQVCVEEGRDWIGFDLDERAVGWHAGRLRSLPVRSLFAPASVAD